MVNIIHTSKVITILEEKREVELLVGLFYNKSRERIWKGSVEQERGEGSADLRNGSSIVDSLVLSSSITSLFLLVLRAF